MRTMERMPTHGTYAPYEELALRIDYLVDHLVDHLYRAERRGADPVYVENAQIEIQYLQEQLHDLESLTDWDAKY